MFKNLNKQSIHPERVVILGGQGFVGSAVAKRLHEDNLSVLALGREDIDLLQQASAQKLVNLLNPSDVLFITSAKAPCKNHTMLLDNILMIKNVCDALSQCPVSHLIYISSDAVYADSDVALNEASSTAPASLHGVMHLARELMLASVIGDTPFLCLRPSLIYGENDPHNGYGPNSFYRLAKKGEPITLFGQGEEQRDHVFIDDVAEVAWLSILYRSIGKLNIATGKTISFCEIAQKIINTVGQSNELKMRPRNGPMPHNGRRPFDATCCQVAWPNFRYTDFSEGLAKLHARFDQKTKGGSYVRN